jgi:hypothetical protein
MMRVGEKSKALSPKRLRLQEDASREPSTPFVESGYKPTANRLGQTMGKKLGPVTAGIKKSKGMPQTSLNLGIGVQKRSKRND